jgi:FSR family fosmidomycin resistance protein-like MFS transporter
LIALPVGVNAGLQLNKVTNRSHEKANQPTKPHTVITYTKFGIVSLALIAALQAWAQLNMITFIPKYLSDLGQSAAIYGLIVGLFMGGSALGNVVGGSLADHFGKKPVITLMLTLSSIPILVISLLGWSAWLYLLVPLAGFLTGAVHSIIVVLAQHIIRSGMALATGLTLGFMFSASALGTLSSGWMADRWGFPLVFQVTASLVIIAACLPIFLQEVSPQFLSKTN